MAERPTESDGPASNVPRPPAAYFIAGVVGFLALAGSVPVTVMVRDFAVVQRLVFGGPLLLLGLSCWAFAILRFADYAVAVRRAREAQPVPVDDREDEDRALIEEAAKVILPPPGLRAPASAGRPAPHRLAKRRPLVAARD